MSFLNPILLAGIATVAIPIIIHLLNRRRFQKVVWAAMRFLHISVEQNHRRMRIEDLILLILRCLLLALLALALARPAILSKTGAWLGNAKVTAVIVLDNSYSMAMSDGTHSRFETARDAAEQALDSMPPGSATALILASDIDHQVIPEPTFDLNLARRLIRDAPLTDRATDLFPAIDSAIAILEDRLALRKEIFIVTDGQAAGWRQLADIQRLLERSRADIQTHLVLVDEGEEQNLALSSLRLASGLSPIDQPLRFEARVTNHGKEEARDVRVTLRVDDAPPSDEFIIDTIAPGASRGVSLFTKLRELGYHAITAGMSADRLPADDSRVLAVRAIRQVRVLLVDGHPGAEPRDSEVYFLRHALQPVPREAQDTYFIQTEVLTSPELSLARMDDYDAVILADVPDLSAATIDQLLQFLRRGGGVMIFTGPDVNVGFYNDTLHDTHRLLPARLGPPEGDAEQAEMYFKLQDKNYTHTITELWNDPAAGTLGTTRIYRRHPLLPVEENLATAGDTGLAREAGLPQVVLSYDDGVPAIMARNWGLGRVIVCGSTGGTRWTDLPVRPSFLPLLHRSLGALVQRQDEGLNLQVGEPFRRRVKPEFLGKDATLVPPGKTDAVGDLRRVELVDGVPMLAYQETDFAGLYGIQVVEPPLEMRFATQADGRESSLDRLSDAQRSTLKEVANVIEWTPGMSLRDQVVEERSGLEFWLPIIVLVTLLALLETFLGQWFSRSK